MPHEFILTDTVGDGPLKTGLITLNRPKQLNALNDGLMRRARRRAARASTPTTIGCIVITGSEKRVCCGRRHFGAMAHADLTMEAYGRTSSPATGKRCRSRSANL
jgi:enoyl-CoA hydratase